MLGFEEVDIKFGNKNVRSYVRKNDLKNTYLGTCQDIFNNLNDDIFVVGIKFIRITEVFRHNGTDKNTSLSIGIGYNKFNALKHYQIDGIDQISYYTPLYLERVKKINPNASDKIIENTIKNAMEKLDEIKIPNYDI